MTKKTVRHPRNRRAIILLAGGFVIISIVLALVLVRRNFPQAGDQNKEKIISSPAPDLAVAPQVVREAFQVHKEVVRRGQRLADVLKKYHFTAAEILRLREEIRAVYDLRKIVAGNEIRLMTTAEGEFGALEYDIDEEKYLRVENQAGRFRGEIKFFPFETKIAMIWAKIDDNPIAAVESAKEGDLLALEMADLFAWDIDFYTDLRRGDAFKLLFEKKYLNGEFSGYGGILAAEFVNQGKVFQAFRFVYPDTKKSDHFDAQGNSLRKEFMKSPLKYARITSRFSFHRLHPIHKVYRAHYGVDYGAPIGTPVQATAEGTVVLADWSGASGRMVKVRHKNGYETMYLHLSGIAVQPGQKVAGGQIIGYVGSSGEATGPHLDYRIQYHGSYINPLGWRFQPIEPLRPEFKERYRSEVEFYQRMLDSPLDFFQSLTNCLF